MKGIRSGIGIKQATAASWRMASQESISVAAIVSINGGKNSAGKSRRRRAGEKRKIINSGSDLRRKAATRHRGIARLANAQHKPHQQQPCARGHIGVKRL